MTGKYASIAKTMCQSKDTKHSVSTVNVPENVAHKSLDHHGVSCKSTARVHTN
jgi:hypothetical protein